MAHQTESLANAFEDCLNGRTDQNGACPVESTLNALRGRWTPAVLAEFFRQPDHTFSQLKQSVVPISDKTLTERLRQLVDAGILHRTQQKDWPPRVTYSLTDRGAELRPLLAAMWNWGRFERNT